MKKRLFTTLLLLCLLLTALTATVAATESATPSFTHTDTSHAEYSISFAFKAYYRCPGNLVTAVSPTDPYTVTNINSWTSDEIEFQINVTSVRCAGDSSIQHGAHSHDVVHPSKRVTFSGKDLCHKTLNLTTTIKDVIYDGQDDELEFTVTTALPRYQLVPHAASQSTCITYGYSEDCYECPGCKKLFKDQNAEQELPASVRLDKTSHNYVDGICKDCGAGSAAYTLTSDGSKTYYKTVDNALTAAYTSQNLSVWITNYDKAITLANSCNVYVCNGVTIPNISTSAPDSEAAININITNYGTIGTIAPASSGAQSWKITNHGRITEKIYIPNNASLSMEITNNGTITLLDAKKPIKLLSGIGTYGWIGTENTNFGLGVLLDADCKFCQDGYQGSKNWYGSDYATHGTNNLVVTKPPFSVTVTGPDGFHPDESGGYSLTLATKDVQNQTLTASLSYPDASSSLSSKNAEFIYGWYYASDAAARWSTDVLPLSDLPVGVHQLTLRVTDSKYNYTHSINVTVTITSDDGEKVSISPKTPEGTFTKMYDGTASIPEDLPIIFTANGKELVLQQVTSDDEAAEEEVGYRIVEAAYNSPNCKDANTIIVKVKLTAAAKEIYELTTDTFTVKGTITKFKPEGNDPFFYFYAIKYDAKVGDRIMDHLPKQKDAKDAFKYLNSSKYGAIPNPLDANPTITYYRMRSKDIYDPTTDEKITETSIFAYEGEYYIYAVVEATGNYADLFTQCTPLNAKSTSGSHTHCLYGHKDCAAEVPLTYNGFPGDSLSPDGTQDQRSYYLNAQRSTVNLELILRPLSDSSSETPSLDLCLYGKTLRVASDYPAQFRVSNKWHLTLTDCIGTGVLKGTRVDDEYGGCLYVADATAEFYNIKVTGGSSSKLGGAIVVGDKGILNIYDGEISGNTVTGGNGGAIYIKSGGTVNIYGGTITNNHVYSGNGGAIYVEKGAVLNLYGGEISGNTASTLGGGIYVEAGGKVTIQGNPVVTGNTVGGKANNLYVCVDSTSPLLTISGELTDGAKLGVSTNASYPVLLAGSKQDYSAYFTPDDPDAFVISSGTALTLCTKPSATLEGDTLTVKTGGNYMDGTVLLFVAEYSTDGRMLTAQSKEIKLGIPDYTFEVNSSKIKCFLLNAKTYTPLMEAFVFN